MKAIKSLILTVVIEMSALATFADAPIITSQPVGAVVGLGQPASLTVTNGGTGPLSYQWLKDGVILPGQTNSTLSYAAFQFTNSGSYHVVITNADGLTISFPASLSVSNAPLQVWGNNSFGQLGIGPTMITNRPTLLTNNVVAAAGGFSHTLFVKADGTLWAMGKNDVGQLGDGMTNNRNLPIAVASNVVAVAAGGHHSLFARGDGTLWSMGYNGYGQLGDGTTNDSPNPLIVASNVVAVVGGTRFSLFVKADGTLWAMGYNSSGQLGDGTTNDSSQPLIVASNVVAAAAGSSHSLFVKADGTLWAMGAGDKLGIGPQGSTNLPIMVTNNVIAAVAAHDHSLFVRADGTLWAMGTNGSGQLGIGSTVGTNRPTLVTNNVVAVAAGGFNSLFVKTDGTLWATGMNSSGQLGIGTTGGFSNRPVLVNGGGMITASLGKGTMGSHSSAVAYVTPLLGALPNQTVKFGQPAAFTASVSGGDGPFTFQWQFNDTNLLDATNATYTIASVTWINVGSYRVIVSGPIGSASTTALLGVITMQPASGVLRLGQPASLSVTNGGTGPFGYQWLKDGAILGGQTNSTLSFASFQFTNSGTYNVVITNADGLVISFPASMSMSNAPLRAWGYNYYGQLGTGTLGDSNRPALVTNNVVAVAASASHSLFVKADGTLWAMGLNGSGQLGIGSTNDSSLPFAVATNVVAVAAGQSHSLFVKADGTLWAMGNNGSGQLGIGSTGTTNLPVLVTNNVVAVAAGSGHSLFVQGDGTLWAMGANPSGQLGNGTWVNTNRPMLVTNNVVSVSAGSAHSLFVRADGILWAMGLNGSGQLGIGSTVSTNRPTLVTNNVVAAAGGGSHSLFVQGDGTLWAMGANPSGQLGIGTNDSVAHSLPVQVTTNVVAVAAGVTHSLFVKADGTLWAMGNNGLGQLGNGIWVNTNRPVLVNGGGLIAASLPKEPTANHSLAIMGATPTVDALSNQTVNLGQPASFTAFVSAGDGPFTYQWQKNGTNLADATNTSYAIVSAALSDAGNYSVVVTSPFASASTSAALVVIDPPIITSQPVSAVVGVGQPASLSVTNGGIGPFSYQWLKDGVILTGQTNITLSFASFQFTNSGSYIVVITNADGLAISFPASLSLSNAPLRSWGYNFNGQLGLGSTANANLPVLVTNSVVAVAAGASHSLLVQADGTLWAMGNNGIGQLGIGTTGGSTNLPVLVTNNVVAAAAGSGHSLFVKADGTLWAMGSNFDGQLGDSTTNDSNLPVLVTNNVVAVAAGSSHSLFVKADGTLWAMGYNRSGQLGNGSTVTTNLPVLVTNDVVAVAAGQSHSLFVKTDGTLWAMGYNGSGQLGIGTNDGVPHPIPVFVTNGVVTVASGANHSLFVKSDSTLWAMGDNIYGKLGIGTTGGSTNLPVMVTNDVVAVAGGSYHSLFIRADGTLWAMGYNGNGQLGDGTSTDRRWPVLVNGGGLLTASLAKEPMANHALAIAAPIVAALKSQTVNLGQAAFFTASVPGGDGPFTYQWQLNGTNLVDATNASYTIASAALTDAGIYRVIVTGPFGSASASATLTVIDPPIITSQPVSTVVALDQPASLSVTNGGVAPFTYQWLKDGAILPGQTNSTLSFTSFQFTNSGSYNVVITNADGLAISFPASLSLSNAPLRSWGRNTSGQLGIGTLTDTNRPALVTNNLIAVAAGSFHSLFVQAGGTLWAMGNNSSGQLGIGPTGTSNQPTLVTNNVAAVAAGDAHSLVLKDDGTLWVMGNNANGQLGIDTPGGSTNRPTLVTNNVVAVAAGAVHSLFVKADGTLWAMGGNNYGKLGVGTTGGNSNRPVLVTNNVVAVAAGAEHSLFVKMDGTLWAMGYNGSGQLGIGMAGGSTNRPTLVTNDVVAVAAGNNHSVFVKTDGALFAMGDNAYGKLGIGTTGGNTNWPVFVTNNVVAVAGGNSHSLFSQADGTLWAMGYNTYGQLGNSNWVNANRPVLVNGGGLTTTTLAKDPMANHSLAIAGAAPVVSALTNRTVNAGQPTSFIASVSGGDGPFTYQWQKNGTNLMVATNTSFMITSTAMTNAGNYNVIVTGPFGSASASAALVVINPPTITNQPFSAVVALGQTASLTVTHGGVGPFAYQWIKDGVILMGQTNRFLTYTNFQFTNSGSYQIVIANPDELSISLPASLSVTNAPLQVWGNNGYGQLGNGTTNNSSVPTNLTNNVVAVAGGYGHTLFVKADRSLWAMGWNNNYGQLGTGTGNTNRPVLVTSNVVAVAGGTQHSLFIKADGTLWGMGDDNSGQLGNGVFVSSPIMMASNVVAAATGDRYSLFVKANGTLWAVGDNSSGQLGYGLTGGTTNQPVNVASNVVTLACGYEHSLFVKADRTLWVMGDNSGDQLGIGLSATSTNRPTLLTSNVVGVAAGFWHSLFVKTDGALWAMGQNSAGQLGTSNNNYYSSPIKVTSNVVAVAAGFEHSLFLKRDGTMWVMGDNSSGQLGNGRTNNSNVPILVTNSSGSLITASLARASMANHSLAVAGVAPVLDALIGRTVILGQPASFAVSVSGGDGPFTYQWQFNGTNLATGTNASYTIASTALTNVGSYRVIVSGPLGSASTSALLGVITIQPVSGVLRLGQSASLSVTNGGIGAYGYQWLKDGMILPGQTNSTLTYAAFQFTNSGSYQLAITNAGGLTISFPASLSLSNAPLRAWGYNYYGQLGNGTYSDTNRPTQVASNVVAAAAGFQHSLLVKADGTLWVMGDNSSGQLGIGATPTTTNRPTQAQTASAVTAVAAGFQHSLLLQEDGTLWAMGDNSYGQLGNAQTLIHKTRPAWVTTDVVALAAGGDHSLFVKADGTLWAMGQNASGQLGIGTSDDAPHPFPMYVTNNVVAVAAGANHSLFVKADGTLWAMGNNYYGQLGNGTWVNTNRPALVTNGVVAAAAGMGHTLFVKTDGTLLAMGYNFGINRPVPVTNNVVAVAAGYQHSLFVQADGNLWAMGGNGYGQLGIGMQIDINRPVMVNGGGLIAASLAKGPVANHSLAVAYVSPVVGISPSQTVHVGQSANFTASVSGGDGPFTYQWQWNGTNLVNATNASYMVASAVFTNAGNYTVVVSGPFGSASASATLTVCNPPLITTQPVSAVVGLGQSASLSFTNDGTPPFSYQWLKDGAILPGQTNSTLSFASFQFTNSGSYNVVITNAGGLAISFPATLSFSNAPLWGWGNNSYGQLGIGTTANTNRPVLVTNNVVAVAAGASNSLFLKANGTLWATGIYTNRPVMVTNNVVAVAAGASHSLFVKKDGTLWAMGDNAFGKLGNGNYVPQNLPIQITSNVVAVAAGTNHSLFVKTDGTLWAMGDNSSGQLGIGFMPNTNRPAWVANNVIAVAAGANHSLFVQTDGTLSAMGYNNYGQLGVGPTGNQLWPIPVTNGVIAVAAGSGHSLFVKADGALWAMGNNGSGQLGLASMGNPNRPVRLWNQVKAVAGGASHSLFVSADGKLWAMGANGYGQLGLGTLVQTTQPMLVNGGGLLTASLAKGCMANHALAIAAPIVAALKNQTVNLGQPVSFTASVPGGDNSFTHQWQWNGTNLVDATNAIYQIASAALADAGFYSVVSTGPFGTTSTGASLSVNREPTANALVMGALTGIPQTLLIIGGANPPFDADGDALEVVGVTQGTNGATVTPDYLNVIYTSANTFTGTDSFDYVVCDFRGGFATNTVTVTVIAQAPGYNLLSVTGTISDGTVILTYAGIPYYSYALDWATSLNSPIDWIPLATNPADAGGVLVFTNSPDTTTNSFWRIRSVP